MSGICPVTGEPCNNPSVFMILEQLGGDKSQTTSCCRRCAEAFIRGRNNLSLSRSLELQGIPVLTPTEFINKVLGLANHPYPQEGYVHLSPTEQIQVLEKSMARAVERENYEEAAKIRDMIEKIKGSSPPNG